MGLRFLGVLLLTSLRASLALRGAFFVQVAFMALNNLCFFSTWWLLFQRFDEVRGFHLSDMLALFGVSSSGFGLAAVTSGGMFELSRLIVEGELDALLCQPRNVLLRAIASRSRASGWGDIASGALLLGLSGYVHLQTLPVAVLAVLLAALTYVSCAVIMHSLAFFLGNVESLARAFFEFAISFSLYPPSLFGGALRVVLFTLIPAGLISYLPVELLRGFTTRDALVASCSVAAYATVAVWLFGAGLRRYESGNRFAVFG